MKSPEDIVGLLKERESSLEPTFSRMRRVKAAYNGDIVVPLPELDNNEQVAVANLLAQGLDQTAMRVASVMPDVVMPPIKDDQKQSEKRASVRRRAVLGWWEHNKMDIKLSKRARHMLGYACSPVSLRYNPVTGVPEWTVRDPLTTFPSPLFGPDDMAPHDTIFTYERTYDWLRANYPEQAMRVYQDGTDGSDLYQLIEYCDAEETVLLVMGQSPEEKNNWYQHSDYMAPVAELERTINRAGICPVVIAGRVNLGEPQGQFDQMLGMYQMQAKLMALEVLAVQKGIFPDSWLVANPGETPQIINTANGLTGEVGIIKGGQLKDSTVNPGFMTNPTIDRLERGQRLTAGIPSEFGGESGSNIRTGRRGEAVLSAVVDFPVQEAQRMIATSLELENKRAIALMKAYAGNKPKSFYVTMKGAKGVVDYTPNKDFETDENRVVFSHPGTDMNNMVIGAGQRIGMGTLSKRSFMQIDPMVDDAEHEHDAVIAENLEQALLASIQTQASQGAIPPNDLAKIANLVRTNRAELAEAVEKVQKEAQERQATEAPAGSPETMSGIAQPGAGAEQTAAPPAGRPQLRELLGQVR
ncbi:MAG: hypothetical protein CMG34_07805 [Candidatus Marinimicrobia bacterium]|nr:hypothetical protein [Candidatus Neomarinimicrobiota bacterium]